MANYIDLIRNDQNEKNEKDFLHVLIHHYNDEWNSLKMADLIIGLMTAAPKNSGIGLNILL